ncbi:MAG: AAA family ATPase, partial [Bacteroidaceae bacterium]|nr:AAA family ATPase [Bacteroidaceae bacterium]
MLKHLHIENYALIESLDIDLNDGFSVITGETGAGKSILLGAIGLLTGERADLSAIQTGKQRCILEATFNPEGYDLESFFQDEDLDFDPSECIIRRELTANGKSRAFIN